MRTLLECVVLGLFVTLVLLSISTTSGKEPTDARFRQCSHQLIKAPDHSGQCIPPLVPLAPGKELAMGT